MKPFYLLLLAFVIPTVFAGCGTFRDSWVVHQGDDRGKYKMGSPDSEASPYRRVDE